MLRPDCPAQDPRRSCFDDRRYADRAECGFQLPRDVAAGGLASSDILPISDGKRATFLSSERSATEARCAAPRRTTGTASTIQAGPVGQGPDLDSGRPPIPQPKCHYAIVELRGCDTGQCLLGALVPAAGPRSRGVRLRPWSFVGRRSSTKPGGGNCRPIDSKITALVGDEMNRRCLPAANVSVDRRRYPMPGSRNRYFRSRSCRPDI